MFFETHTDEIIAWINHPSTTNDDGVTLYAFTGAIISRMREDGIVRKRQDETSIVHQESFGVPMAL